MSAHRQLPLSRLGHLVPPLIERAALLVLVPTTDDLAGAAKAVWDIARIAPRDGRRVALVDLSVELPALHDIVSGSLGATEGIVDAFEYGVSLNKAAHATSLEAAARPEADRMLVRVHDRGGDDGNPPRYCLVRRAGR